MISSAVTPFLRRRQARTYSFLLWPSRVPLAAFFAPLPAFSALAGLAAFFAAALAVFCALAGFSAAAAFLVGAVFSVAVFAPYSATTAVFSVASATAAAFSSSFLLGGLGRAPRFIALVARKGKRNSSHHRPPYVTLLCKPPARVSGYESLNSLRPCTVCVSLR